MEELKFQNTKDVIKNLSNEIFRSFRNMIENPFDSLNPVILKSTITNFSSLHQIFGYVPSSLLKSSRVTDLEKIRGLF
jgi:hypothetical protein